MTKAQIAALRYIIAHSKDAGSLVKQVAWLLINKSKGLTKEVRIDLPVGWSGFDTQEVRVVADGIHDMNSVNGTTHLNEVLAAAGSDFKFDFKAGSFDAVGMLVSDEKTEKVYQGYSVWLGRPYTSRTAERVIATREEVEALDLALPGLYPEIEVSLKKSRTAAYA